MPLKFVDHYTPQDCQAHPDYLFVFGDNFRRAGKAGQAIIRDEPNAIGVATKWVPAMKSVAFFTDADLSVWREWNAGAFSEIENKLASGGIVILPMAGLGSGMAELPDRAPLIWAELCSMIDMWKRKYKVAK